MKSTARTWAASGNLSVLANFSRSSTIVTLKPAIAADREMYFDTWPPPKITRLGLPVTGSRINSPRFDVTRWVSWRRYAFSSASVRPGTAFEPDVRELGNDNCNVAPGRGLDNHLPSVLPSPERSVARM